MKRAGTFIAGLATVTALVAAQGAQAAYPGANGGLAFERAVAGGHRPSAQIFKVGPGGSGEALLAAARGDLPTAPSFSADGSRVVFERQTALGYGSIQVARADGSGARTIPGEGHHPSLSPNGSRLALDSGGSIFTETANGTRRTRIAGGTDPEWSPDGRSIAFVRDGNLYLVHASGGAERRLTSDGGNAGPSWAPSGKAIAFWHGYTVATVSSNGSGRRSLAGGMQPAWSPDGKLIAYAGDGGVWTMRPNGAAKRLLVRDAFLPAWQPR
ncbi:MAG: TolB family protein [Gaiellaceae bacterium]